MGFLRRRSHGEEPERPVEQEADRDLRQLMMKVLIAEARTYGTVDTLIIPPDARVQIGLINERDFSFMRRPSELAHAPSTTVDLTSLGEGNFKLTGNDRDVMKLGRPEDSGKGQSLSPVLKFGLPLAYETAGRIDTIRNEYVGLLAVEGTQLFGPNIDT